MTLDACAALVERGDPDRFAECMAAPVAARARLWPLYALNLELARVPWLASQPMIAEMRLEWWRGVLADAARGVVVPGHAVLVPLAVLLGAVDLPLAVLDRLVEARRWDIWSDPFADRAGFDAYLDDTAGGLMWLAARALGAPDSAEPVVRGAGWAMGLAGFLRAVPELAARGRVPLCDPRPEAVAALAREGLARLAAARRNRRLVPAAARPALLAGWQSGALLALVADDPARVAEGRVQRSEVARRGGLLWAAVSGRW
ncbi:MAG: squalene/phytoene synthase family protein [Pseudorhodobacter sp.]|nr:squalene/phytoene synthase family protein [Pseudorhodobacter sp.]